MSTTSTESNTGTPAGGGQNAPESASQGTEAPEDRTTRELAVKKAYAEATTALRQAYRDEFNTDVAKRVKAAGFEWSPRPTEEEKRAAKFKALLAEDPSLADIVTEGSDLS
jgi:hypothetical protein